MSWKYLESRITGVMPMVTFAMFKALQTLFQGTFVSDPGDSVGRSENTNKGEGSVAGVLAAVPE